MYLHVSTEFGLEDCCSDICYSDIYMGRGSQEVRFTHIT